MERPSSGIDLSLQHPLAQRLRTDPQLRPQRLGHAPRRAVLIHSINRHPGRAHPLLGGIPLRHDLHPSQERKRHQTRDGSLHPTAREQIQNALDHFKNLVDRIPAAAWDNTTPCAQWDVRDLLNHMTSEHLWAPRLLAGETVEEVGDTYNGDR